MAAAPAPPLYSNIPLMGSTFGEQTKRDKQNIRYSLFPFPSSIM
jgi:hypothetical protein